MQWTYQNKPIDEDTLSEYIGFVYQITNLLSQRKYIGKKLLKFTRRKKVAGQTRKKKHVIESDWKTYYGSNKELQEDVESMGEEYFTREILRFCKTKSECSYWEAKLQFEKDVLMHPELYYNGNIMVKLHRNHVVSFSSGNESSKE